MTKPFERKPAIKKHHGKVTRRILVAVGERERRPLLEEIKRKIRTAAEQALRTIDLLRRDYGVALPKLSPEWDLVPTEDPNPSQTIAAFDGNRSEIRITLHLDDLLDNTTAEQLESFKISHLIGISTGHSDNTWDRSGGGMIAVINTEVEFLAGLLHDMLLDMAMVYAKGKPWSGIREQLNSHTIAALKAQFANEHGLLERLSYHAARDCTYFPLAALARHDDGFDLKRYITLWSEFAAFAKKHTNRVWSKKQSLDALILASHQNGGQISPAKLSNTIAKLAAGHYCLYFLIRKTRNQHKVAALSTFFRSSKSKFRTQRWIIYPRDAYAKEVSVFLSERYISIFPFYVGENNE